MAPLNTTKSEQMWIQNLVLGYPIHHPLQVGSVSFLQTEKKKKGLCREDMCAQHFVAGFMELYVQDMLCCLPRELVFRL